jgi:hypothetical protein
MGGRLDKRAITLYLNVFKNCLPVVLFEFKDHLEQNASVIVFQSFEGRETKVPYTHEFRILTRRSV